MVGFGSPWVKTEPNSLLPFPDLGVELLLDASLQSCPAVFIAVETTYAVEVTTVQRWVCFSMSV
jgi:hypothetical protein